MRTTAKVCIIIGIISGVFLIFPVIVGAKALQKLDKVKTVKKLRGIAFITLFFCSLVGGIVMLCMNDMDLTYNYANNLVAKTFIIIGMVSSFFLILPVIIGWIALKKIDYSTQKSELTPMGICCMVFCSLIGGIFMLCMNERYVGLMNNIEQTTVRQAKKQKITTIIVCLCAGFFASFLLMGIMLCVFYYTGIHI